MERRGAAQPQALMVSGTAEKPEGESSQQLLEWIGVWVPNSPAATAQGLSCVSLPTCYPVSAAPRPVASFPVPPGHLSVTIYPLS